MEKLIDSLYESTMVDSGTEFIPLDEEVKRHYNALGSLCLGSETDERISELTGEYSEYGFANGFACAMHLLIECGFNADKLTEQAGKLLKSKQENPAGAAQGAEDKSGQEDKSSSGTAAAEINETAQEQQVCCIVDVKTLLDDISKDISKAIVMAGDTKSLHFDYEASTKFDILIDYLNSIGQAALCGIKKIERLLA